MTRISLTLAVLSATAAPALAFPTGAEVPTFSWPTLTTSQSCTDPATLSAVSCDRR